MSQFLPEEVRKLVVLLLRFDVHSVPRIRRRCWVAVGFADILGLEVLSLLEPRVVDCEVSVFVDLAFDASDVDI